MAGSNPFVRSLVTSLRFHIVAADDDDGDDDEGEESGIEKRRRALSAGGGDAVRRIIPDWMAYWDLNGALIGDIRGTGRRRADCKFRLRIKRKGLVCLFGYSLCTWLH